VAAISMLVKEIETCLVRERGAQLKQDRFIHSHANHSALIRE